MNRFVHAFTAGAFIVGLAGGVASAQQPGAGGQGRGGQAPAPPQNLQVLAKDITRQDLQNTMRGFTSALGVMCDHCHVTEPARDFASDAKQTKKTARVMMQMTAHVNETIGAGVGKPAADVTRVQCATCHRGHAIPEAPVPSPPTDRAR